MAGTPYLLEPGVVLGILLIALWWAIARHGARRIARATGRGAAHMLDAAARIGLRAEYRSTAAKRKAGASPSPAARRFGDRMERTAQTATAMYERCGRRPVEPLQSRVLPLSLLAVPILLSLVFGFLPTYLPVTSPLRFRIAQAEARWVDIRSSIGEPVALDPFPVVVRSNRHPGTVSVRLACRSEDSCSGWLALERRDHRLHERYVTVSAQRQKIVVLELQGSDRWIATHGQLRFRRP